MDQQSAAAENANDPSIRCGALTLWLALALGAASLALASLPRPAGATGAAPAHGYGSLAMLADRGLKAGASAPNPERPMRLIVQVGTADSILPDPADALGILAHQAEVSALQSRVLERLGLRAAQEAAFRVKRFEFLPGFAMEASKEDQAALAQDPDVLSVVEDRMLEPFLAESVPLLGALPDSSFRGYTGAGQVVAVLDTGVDEFHPMMAGKMVAQACFTSGGWGLVPLCRGGLSNMTGDGTGADCPAEITGCGHGTHVAGIIAGNGMGISGVAQDAGLISVKVVTHDLEANRAVAFDSDILLGLEQVFRLRETHPIAAVNLSFGAGRYRERCDAVSPLMKAAIDNLRAAGIATVVATGNDGHLDAIAYPACISSAISVASTTKEDVVSRFSNVSEALDLFAPGERIVSAWPSLGIEPRDGTSMAAPHVTGAWAILRQVDPTLDVATIRSLLQNSGLLIQDFELIRPRVRLDAALEAVLQGLPEEDYLSVPEGELSVTNTVRSRQNTLPSTVSSAPVKDSDNSELQMLLGGDSFCEPEDQMLNTGPDVGQTLELSGCRRILVAGTVQVPQQAALRLGAWEFIRFQPGFRVVAGGRLTARVGADQKPQPQTLIWDQGLWDQNAWH